jgi:hypothetical protein
MENKDTKPVMKKEYATLPPKRGQIKAKIIEELIEGVISITTGGSTGKKSDQDSSKSSHS